VSELSDVLDTIAGLDERGERFALATIVAVRGSTYRRPGARLVVPERGESVGNISGGCLEGDVERIGREVIASGVPLLELFDLSADDDAVWGYGLGCNGAMELFIEPGDGAGEFARQLRAMMGEGRPACLATVLEGTAAGTRLLVTAGQADGDGPLADAAHRALAAGTSSVETVGLADGEARVFLEVLKPPLSLLICGAGHDAIPLVRQAADLGWRVTVVDPRSAFLTAYRFPGATELLEADGDELAGRTIIDSDTYAVVMTHNYLRDLGYLRALLATEAGYIGMLGPRRRTGQILGELAEQGITITPADQARLHAPAGLDLGAEGPDEIATSIVAEVLAVARGRGGGPLRERRGSIHAAEPAAPAAQPPT
jgi:xanthine dehydrogenase accessory factor